MPHEKLATQVLDKAFALPLDQASKHSQVVIYGAGDAGQYLARLAQQQDIKLAGFLDDFYDGKTCADLPVFSVKEGLAQLRPDAVILGSITAIERMTRNLEAAGFSGTVCSIRDPWSYCRSDHHAYRVSPISELEPYRNKHLGQRAFVIGNGPSLLKTDPRRLTNDITFACNNIFLLEGFTPSYYMAIDPALTQDRAQEINALPWTKFFPSTVSDWITNGTFIKAVRNEHPSAFSTDMTQWLEIGFTVTYSMLQLAFFMGCDPVYLIGVDHTYKVDKKQSHRDGTVLTSMDADPNHFHPDYFGPGYRWHDPDFEKITEAYKAANAAYKQHNRTIQNATAGGAVEVFPRVSFEEVVNHGKHGIH